MIVPMKKISLVLLDSERKTALKKLRALGLVHVEHIEGKSEALSRCKSDCEKLHSAYALTADVKQAKKKQKDIGTEQALAKANEIVERYALLKDADDKAAAAKAELERLRGWGAVNTDDLAFLAGKGIGLCLYEIPNDKYDELGEDVETVFLNRDKNTTRFLLIEREGGVRIGKTSLKETLPPEAYAVPLPEMPTVQLEQKIKEYAELRARLSGQITADAVYAQSIKKAACEAEKAAEFENLYSGMGHEEEGKHALAWLSGFVPATDLPRLAECAKKENWALLSAEPAPDEEVPTKLKNNKLISLIYPLSDFLDTVPGYREHDISGWFLLFFAVFFGMIFGDAGYGSLMLIMALCAALFSVLKRKKVKPEIGLLFILGLSTVVWGSVTCSWFGIPVDKLPAFLVSLSFEPLSSAYAAQSPENNRRVVQNLQIFCFCLALLQLSIAHLKSIVRSIAERSLKALGDTGSLFMLWGMFYVVLNMVVDKVRFPFDASIPLDIFSAYSIAYPVGAFVAGGFMLSFVFSNYEGSVKESVLASLKNIISVLLGVVNVFSDIVSYIRLWAVGLAGAAISSTVNSMAGPFLGGFLMFAAVLILAFGHGLNIILNMLSVIVHGVRLNTLEFSGHLGMSWSGFKYKPFSE